MLLRVANSFWCTWTEFAALPRDAELLFGWTRELRTHGLRVDLMALHDSILTFTLHTRLDTN